MEILEDFGLAAGDLAVVEVLEAVVEEEVEQGEAFNRR